MHSQRSWRNLTVHPSLLSSIRPFIHQYIRPLMRPSVCTVHSSVRSFFLPYVPIFRHIFVRASVLSSHPSLRPLIFPSSNSSVCTVHSFLHSFFLPSVAIFLRIFVRACVLSSHSSLRPLVCPSYNPSVCSRRQDHTNRQYYSPGLAMCSFTRNDGGGCSMFGGSAIKPKRTNQPISVGKKSRRISRTQRN